MNSTTSDFIAKDPWITYPWLRSQDTKTEYVNPRDIEAIRNKCIELGYLNAQKQVDTVDEEGKNMENLNNTPEVAPPVPTPLTPEQMAKLMEEMANQPITTDEAEPTDAERVLH